MSHGIVIITVCNKGYFVRNEKNTKSCFPRAGLGTRFLPAAKAMPKELLPIDKPLIQFAVEEAIAAGINTNICYGTQ